MTLTLVLPAKKRPNELRYIHDVLRMYSNVDSHIKKKASLFVLFSKGNSNISLVNRKSKASSTLPSDNKLCTFLKIEIAYTSSRKFTFLSRPTDSLKIDRNRIRMIIEIGVDCFQSAVYRVTVNSFLHTIGNMKMSTDSSF